jgi:cob(I)alamin adenosyltransferase
MKIYTRSGDKGKTSLLYGERVKKSDQRVEAYGTCDEANSAIGLALSLLVLDDQEAEKDIKETLNLVQTTLFYVGAELATPIGKKVMNAVTEDHVRELEVCIDRWEENLKELKNFILPGGNSAAAALHMARTIVRRAERCAVDIDQVNPIIISYLNRLSDLLFVAGRYVNSKKGIIDVLVKVQE